MLLRGTVILQGSILYRISHTNSISHRTVGPNKQFILTSTENLLKNVLDLLSQNHQGRARAYEYSMYLSSI